MVDYNNILSDKVKNIKPSGIRKFFDILGTMNNVISLGVGEPDFDTPFAIKRAGIQSIEKGNTFYSSNLGLPKLREEISNNFHKLNNIKYNPLDEVLVTAGASEAIDNALRAIITDGDEVLIPEPSFVCYTPLTALAGGVPVPVPLDINDDFKLTPQKLKNAITPKTKVLILSFPCNPTGAIMTRDELCEIAKILEDTNIIVISDEIYSHLTYDTGHTSFASIPNMRERSIIINGFSKSYAMTGWRLGYVLAPREIISAICKIHQFAIMSAPSVSQYAGIEALQSGDDDILRMKNEYNIRRKFLFNELNSMGLKCFEPFGAFYMFPCIKSTKLSSEEFCEKLLTQQKVAVIPGNAFGECGEGFIRISYSYSLKHLMEACKRIRIFLETL